MRLLVNGLEAQGMGLQVAPAAVIEPPAPADGATADELTLYKIRMALFEKDETRRKDFVTTCNKLMADNVSDTIKLSFASWGTSTPATKLASMDTAYIKLSDKQAMAELERFNYTDKLSLADNIANFQRAHRALSGNVNMPTPSMAAAKFRAMIEAYISKHSNFDMNNAMARDVGPLTSLHQFFDLAVGWAIMYAAEPTKFAAAHMASGRPKERTSGRTGKDKDLGYFTVPPDTSRGDRERIRNQTKRPPTDRHGHNAVKCDTHGWCGHSNAECSTQKTKPKASAAKAKSHAASETDESSIESDDLAIYQKVAKKKGKARANVARNIFNQLTSGSADLAMDDTGASHTFLTTKDAGKYGYDVKALEPPLEIGVADDHGTESSAEANKTCTIVIFGTPRKVHIVDAFQRSLIGNDVKEKVMSVTLKGVSYYFDIASRTGLVIKTSTQNPDSGLFDFNLEEQKHAPAPDSVRAELERIAYNVRTAKATSARTGIYNLSMRTIANLVTFIVLALACCSRRTFEEGVVRRADQRQSAHPRSHRQDRQRTLQPYIHSLPQQNDRVQG